jgi:hypothetical protein
MAWLVYLMLFVTIIAVSGILLAYVEGRRKHQLEVQQEERLLIEARTREIEARNRQAELEYQSALAELELFDHRGGNAKPLPEAPDRPGTAAD